MRLGIAAKPDDPKRVKLARSVYEYLAPKADVVVQQELADQWKNVNASAPIDKLDVDVLVSVGGDGTILHALMRNRAPIFGINLGELGFLTEAEPIELPDCLDRLLEGRYQLEETLKLETRVDGRPVPEATNEMVLKSPRASKLLQYRIGLDDLEVARVRADGLILSTPIGSTSYAMSAGGPILDPHLEAFLLVPLASFSLFARPFVVPPDRTIEITLLDPAKEAELVIDGQYEDRVEGGEVVTCTAAPHRARFVRFRHNFYDRMRHRFRPG